MSDTLLTLTEGAKALGLSTAETFSRFAKRHGIPLIRFGRKVVRVRTADLERAIASHRDSPRPAEDQPDSRRTQEQSK